MSQKFQAAVHHREDVTYVKLSGVIDEDNELTDLSDKIPPGTAVIDLGDIERINSCGVRDWVNWLGKVEKNSTSVVLVACSPAIVAQINLVNNFTGSGVVKSFYVPYFCPECDEEKVLLVETADMGPPPHEPPTCRCDECDLVMDFDDMPDSYFAFLANQKHLAEPDRINQVISEFSSSDDGEQSRIRTRPSTSSISGHSISSLPSVPSLPSISRTDVSGVNSSMRGMGSFGGFSNTGGSGVGQGTGSGMGMGMGMGQGSNPGLMRPSMPPPKSGAVVYILVGVLLAAIGVLAFLLFSSR
jgi:anti-anti-sigma regulatory factor